MDTNYKVLYRKYRPSNFEELVGQKYTISMLKNAIINDKLSHAYIFTGPRGTGKTSTAKIFAKTINCENIKDGIACGKCNSCLNINNNADIIEIDAASNNGVEEIRELINNVKIAPSFSKYKVYIIDEVHMLSQSAFNALLLTLEEPPSHIIFIFATTNIESVPITILSRCQRYDFKKIDNEDIIEHLKVISKKEKIDISDDALNEISYLSDGGLRDALSILNQLATSNSSISLDTVLDNYGSVSIVQIKKIIECFFANDYDNLKNIFDNLRNSSIDYKTFIKKMIDELFLEALVLKEQGNNEKFTYFKQIIFELNEVINKININIDPFLLIFMIFVENLVIEGKKIEENKELKVESTNIIEKNEEPEQKVELKVTKDKKNDKILENLEELIKIRINNCFFEADKRYLSSSKDNWKKFIENNSLLLNLKNILFDTDVVLASPSINIIIHNQKSAVELFNKELLNIENEYNEYLGQKLKFIALTEEEWDSYKQEYVKNKKSGYKYEYIEEPELTIQEKKTSEDNNISNESDITDIFDESKIEIK